MEMSAALFFRQFCLNADVLPPSRVWARNWLLFFVCLFVLSFVLLRLLSSGGFSHLLAGAESTKLSTPWPPQREAIVCSPLNSPEHTDAPSIRTTENHSLPQMVCAPRNPLNAQPKPLFFSVSPCHQNCKQSWSRQAWALAAAVPRNIDSSPHWVLSGVGKWWLFSIPRLWP